MRTILLFLSAAVVANYSINGAESDGKSFSYDREDVQEISGNKFTKLRVKSHLKSGRQSEQDFTDGESGARAKRQVLKDNVGLNTTWKGGLFYTFNTSDQNVRKTFEMGAKVWSDSTCINFVEDKNAPDKLIVIKANESSATVGRLGGDQFLSLTEEANEATAVHEIGHALGFFHTMQRYDRDNFTKILVENIIPGETEHFEKLSKSLVDVYGLPYDFGSIMHYGEMSYSVNQRPTILAKEPLYQKTMGSDLISFADIYTINEHYGCNKKCNKSTSAKCVNEGFPHPRNCSRCICPGGYGGDLCEQRPPGCGADLMASNVKKLLVVELGLGIGLRKHYDFCHYMIKAPDEKKIVVHVESISEGYENAGCTKGGVEVKAQRDQKMTGYRFCSRIGSGIPIVSNSNKVPLILYNKEGKMEAVFTYHHID